MPNNLGTKCSCNRTFGNRFRVCDTKDDNENPHHHHNTITSRAHFIVMAITVPACPLNSEIQHKHGNTNGGKRLKRFPQLQLSNAQLPIMFATPLYSSKSYGDYYTKRGDPH